MPFNRISSLFSAQSSDATRSTAPASEPKSGTTSKLARSAPANEQADAVGRPSFNGSDRPAGKRGLTTADALALRDGSRRNPLRKNDALKANGLKGDAAIAFIEQAFGDNPDASAKLVKREKFRQRVMSVFRQPTGGLSGRRTSAANGFAGAPGPIENATEPVLFETKIFDNATSDSAIHHAEAETESLSQSLDVSELSDNDSLGDGNSIESLRYYSAESDGSSTSSSVYVDARSTLSFDRDVKSMGVDAMPSPNRLDRPVKEDGQSVDSPPDLFRLPNSQIDSRGFESPLVFDEIENIPGAARDHSPSRFSAYDSIFGDVESNRGSRDDVAAKTSSKKVQWPDEHGDVLKTVMHFLPVREKKSQLPALVSTFANLLSKRRPHPSSPVMLWPEETLHVSRTAAGPKQSARQPNSPEIDVSGLRPRGRSHFLLRSPRNKNYLNDFDFEKQQSFVRRDSPIAERFAHYSALAQKQSNEAHRIVDFLLDTADTDPQADHPLLPDIEQAVEFLLAPAPKKE